MQITFAAPCTYVSLAFAEQLERGLNAERKRLDWLLEYGEPFTRKCIDQNIASDEAKEESK